MGGSKKSEQLQRLAEEPGRLVGSSRFLGRVEVPLSETLSLKRGVLPFCSTEEQPSAIVGVTLQLGDPIHCWYSSWTARDACHALSCLYRALPHMYADRTGCMV